ncbi:MAG: hypothetical protein QG629_743 [Patescibacteria group bacterium]|nr:ATP-binding protein [Candidatus Saccharibacteria bacterium]MDQ5963660.1 hypothetical protein [Patescibacteria group bacterium]
MGKLTPTKPLLVMLYGMPGSGKTFFARQLTEHVKLAHVQSDRIRNELFQNPTYSKDENHIVASIMLYMTEEFLKAGVSVIFDTNAMRIAQRRALRNLAVRSGAESLLLWLQIDPDSAYLRASNRDKRKADDKYAQVMDIPSFKQLLGGMQNPEIIEKVIVLSGKHVFNTQKNAVIRSLKERRLVTSDTQDHLSKPGLINLVPNTGTGRVDMSRRNVRIQ